ncbi:MULTISPECIES: hypothetical protein [unclassified Kitasatospora]|uniref:hypothetical protein n=1 Tax=unclassified Kitasatospora TaxID=2633591 RepID=UPI000B30C23E|nr:MULTISPECIES: hypothetical protein [unclassified Kitasatospora]
MRAEARFMTRIVFEVQLMVRYLPRLVLDQQRWTLTRTLQQMTAHLVQERARAAVGQQSVRPPARRGRRCHARQHAPPRSHLTARPRRAAEQAVVSSA